MFLIPKLRLMVTLWLSSLQIHQRPKKENLSKVKEVPACNFHTRGWDRESWQLGQSPNSLHRWGNQFFSPVRPKHPTSRWCRNLYRLVRLDSAKLDSQLLSITLYHSRQSVLSSAVETRAVLQSSDSFSILISWCPYLHWIRLEVLPGSGVSLCQKSPLSLNAIFCGSLKYLKTISLSILTIVNQFLRRHMQETK